MRMSWMTILAKKKKHSEKRKKWQPTEQQNNAKYQNENWRGPSFYI